MIAAIFDFDGTLVATHVWQRLVRQQLRQRLNILPTLAFVLSHYALYPVARGGLMNAESYRRLWAQHMPWLMAGLAVDRAAALFATVVEQDLLPATRPALLERARWHQDQGHHVMILSGAFEPLLAQYAARTGIPGTAGTALETRSARYTGRLAGPLCFAEGKVTRLKDYIDANALSLDLEASYAYADSYTDLPILQAVGRPVAVAPDAELCRFAADRGWQSL